MNTFKYMLLASLISCNMVFASHEVTPNVQLPTTEVASKSVAEQSDASSVQEQKAQKKRAKRAKCSSGSCNGIFAVIIAGVVGIGALLASIFLGSQSSCCG